MFKDIQKQLLLKYPLLWNTKFIPMLIIGIVLHIVFFGLGYIQGTIDFSNEDNIDIVFPSVSFGILFVIIIVILWLVNYFKNNALKSFYSKSKNSLFYEWLQIFTISFILVSFYMPFTIGKQFHERSYFSKDEAVTRCETISMADIFIDGSFAQTNHTELDSILKSNVREEDYKNYFTSESKENGNPNYLYFHKNYLLFKGKKYSEYSLLNRNLYDFYILSEEQDSLNKFKVQNWLYENKTKEVKDLMASYLQLIKEHKLSINLTVDKWFEVTYNAPEFNKFLYIQPYKEEYETNNYNRYSDFVTAVESPASGKYSKYYIQQNVLKEKYNVVSEAYEDSYFKPEMLLTFLYVAFGFSILLFSFRVTSGKSWLIGLIAVGVINIVYGIFTAVASSGLLYAYLIVFTIIGVLVYFFVVYSNKKSIEYSRIALNLSLWSFALIIPIIYFLIQQSYADEYYAYNYPYQYSKYQWFIDHATEMLGFNFIIAIVVLFGLSRVIRNWKGIAED